MVVCNTIFFIALLLVNVCIYAYCSLHLLNYLCIFVYVVGNAY